jgi:hypothetical protein
MVFGIATRITSSANPPPARAGFFISGTLALARRESVTRQPGHESFMSRPSDYSEAIADRICERMVCGKDEKPESLKFPTLVEIYSLRCPESGEIKYVGKANDALRRFRGHIRDSRRKNTPVCRWISSLAAKNTLPLLEILEQVPESQWKIAERNHIAKHRASGFLLNLSKGGNQPFLSVEQQINSGKRLANSRLGYDANEKRLYEAKRVLGSYLKFLERDKDYDRLQKWKANLRAIANRHPGRFDCWANL